ncbi:MAG: protein-disulfide reductase DsbD domain-containing protein [Isosphaeraceae bacterium]
MPGRFLSQTATLALALVASLVLSPLAFADAAPKKKDSPAGLKPKEVVLSASVTPARAAPGATVTYQVTAKVAPPWHVYTYAKELASEGPRNTQFDVFDQAGLTAVGDWKASRPPITRKEPAFPDLESVSYFEDEVTWSLALKVPANAQGGQKTLRNQIYFQICNEQSCKPPIRSTVPDVTLTIVSNAGAKVETKTESAQPKRPDMERNPTEVRFTTAIEPAEVPPGGTATLRISANLEPGWHIFATTQEGEGGQKTTFDPFETSGLKVVGDWTPSRAPTLKTEFLGTALLEQQYFEDEVTWSAPVQVPEGVDAGRKLIQVQASFQVCSDQFCKPGRLTLPEAVLAVALDAAPTAPVSAAPEIAAAPEVPASKKAVPEVAAASASAAPKTEIEKSLQQGIIPFLLLSIGAGLLALVMPCVWPMVPITVNFFVKQGHAKNGGSTTGLAITYCLSIIGIFTLVGVLFSAAFGASAAQNLATSPWLNAFVAALFLTFGLSLLGLFEFRLPSFLMNASSHGESRGGLLGVVFMALTLTITSFTCTFPVVGGLLVMAATGNYLYPVIGLATFATVLALPFFLLALAPGLMARMPKSGDWMNAVKVVGGLVEMGAAFKFINNVELGMGTIPEDCWFNAPTVLTIWVVLSLVSGIYLLGLFRTDHDHGDVKVGPGRLVIGSLFVFLALFLAPALFGRPPKSQIWDRLIVGLLPPDIDSLKAIPAGGGGVVAEGQARHATSTKPDEAVRQQTSFHGVPWGWSYEAALEQSKAENRPVLIDFTGVYCTNCRQMEQAVMPRPEVVGQLQEFVTVQLYTDIVPIKSLSVDDREELATANQLLEATLVKETTNPFYVALSPSGEILGTLGGYREPSVFVKFLKDALDKHDNAGQVARADLSKTN